MFTFAIIIGIYSYIIFFLGVFGLLYHAMIFWCTVGFIGLVLFLKKDRIKNRLPRSFHSLAMTIKKQRLFLGLFVLLLLQSIVNVIGTLGPELAFDALWYHLTLPKLYLHTHFIEYIPGGLLYYSAMPKLGEMLYTAGLVFGDETIPKLIHFTFGLLTCVALYRLSRKFLSPLYALLAVVIFYANLVVAWESITAYVDLVRAFFEVMALWAFVNWSQTIKRKWFILSAVMAGLAITTKLLALGSLVIFLLLILYRNFAFQSNGSNKNSWKRSFGYSQLHWDSLRMTLSESLNFSFIALLIPLPWFIFSYIHTGNPVYPFFTPLYPISPSDLNVGGFFIDTWILFTQASDPISPVYIIFLPLIIGYKILRLRYRSAQNDKRRGVDLIGIYSLLAIVIWYFTPQTGGGRFILPYLPAFSLLCAFCVYEAMKLNKKFGKFLILIILFVSFLSIGYRFGANMKYLPVIFGQQSKHDFLTNNLNYSYGDFYDTEYAFKKYIKSDEVVLLYGFHNLYYVPSSFVDASWRKNDDSFTYVATKDTALPNEFIGWKLIYENSTTMVKLYKHP